MMPSLLMHIFPDVDMTSVASGREGKSGFGERTFSNRNLFLFLDAGGYI